MAENVKILLDVDTGIDDALAIMYALRAPNTQVLGIGTVAGNTEVERATVNTLKVLELMEAQVPVASGAPKALLRPIATVPFIHGNDGMGDNTYPAPFTSASGEHAVDQILRLAHEYPGEMTLVPVGPLTNIAIALLQEPGVARLFKRVVIMGGAINVPGNVTSVAEANIWHDPEAAQIVFGADWPITLVSLDVTMETFLRPVHWDQLMRSQRPVANFATAITQFYYDSYTRLLGTPGCALHDPLAVAIAIDPTLVTDSVELDISIEQSGAATVGMTVADRRSLLGPGYDQPKRPILVPMKVDEERFVNQFTQALLV